MNDEPDARQARITVTATGPYVVSGNVPLTRAEPVMSEHGEPLTWKTEPSADIGDRYLLCRCGNSANKPMCDGSHARTEWDAEQHPPAEPYADRAAQLGDEGVEIFDDRSICAHAGFCGNEVTNIWKLAKQTGDSRIRAQAMAMIEHCPSGALTYAIDGEQIEPRVPAEIAATADGPLWVTGGIAVECSDGTTLEARHRVTLCRCGQSKQKPLCDGSHHEAGFTG